MCFSKEELVYESVLVALEMLRTKAIVNDLFKKELFSYLNKIKNDNYDFNFVFKNSDSLVLFSVEVIDNGLLLLQTSDNNQTYNQLKTILNGLCKEPSISWDFSYFSNKNNFKKSWSDFLNDNFCRKDENSQNRPCDEGLICSVCEQNDIYEKFIEWRNIGYFEEKPFTKYFCNIQEIFSNDSKEANEIISNLKQIEASCSTSEGALTFIRKNSLTLFGVNSLFLSSSVFPYYFFKNYIKSKTI